MNAPAEVAASRPRQSRAALAALALAVLGLAFFPLSILALGLGVAGLVATRGGRRRGRGLAVTALLLAPLTVLTTGLEASQLVKVFGPPDVAMMTLEARANLALLVRAVEAERRRTGRLPPALARTPAEVPCGSAPQPWPGNAAPGWRALGFAPAQPLRYAYAYAPDADGKSFVVRAYGDLNCDGKTSLYEQRPGELVPRTENPLE